MQKIIDPRHRAGHVTSIYIKKQRIFFKKKREKVLFIFAFLFFSFYVLLFLTTPFPGIGYAWKNKCHGGSILIHKASKQQPLLHACKEMIGWFSR
jgi:hypothetical protein